MRNVFLLNGGGFNGNGCVAAVTSPGVVVRGTGRSSTPYTGSPVTRSNTNNRPILVICATAGMTRPPRRMSNSAGVERHQRVSIEPVSHAILAVEVGGQRTERCIHNSTFYIHRKETPCVRS